MIPCDKDPPKFGNYFIVIIRGHIKLISRYLQAYIHQAASNSGSVINGLGLKQQYYYLFNSESQIFIPYLHVKIRRTSYRMKQRSQPFKLLISITCYCHMMPAASVHGQAQGSSNSLLLLYVFCNLADPIKRDSIRYRYVVQQLP